MDAISVGAVRQHETHSALPSLHCFVVAHTHHRTIVYIDTLIITVKKTEIVIYFSFYE